jgi:hypothetical protein
MKWQAIDIVAIAIAAGAGSAAMYFVMRRAMRRVLIERQQEMYEQLSAMAATVHVLETRVGELSRLAEREQEVASISAAAESAAHSAKEHVKPEILAAMSAAATAFLGKSARILSAHPVPAAQDAAVAWAQQGRVVVQTSHNLRSQR